ncbi:MAG: tetratricopeptide repeat protein [Planctomycetes bacterium]|nr:tetratricopeptide repeat protein [Planctomycetota bacterium]
MSIRTRLLFIVFGFTLPALVGCRSTRYAIGDFLSPDWMTSQASREAYATYSNLAQRHIDQASQARADGDPQRALRHFRQAEVQFKKALDYDSYSLKAHLGAGFALFQQAAELLRYRRNDDQQESIEKKCLEAIDYLEKAADLRSGEWRVHYGLASAYRNLATLAGVRLDRLEAASADPPLRDAEILTAQQQRRSYLEHTLAEARRLQEVAPEQHQSYLLIGMTCANLQRYDEAIAHLEQWLTYARQTREVYEKWQQAGVLPRGVTGSRQELEQKILTNRIRDAEARDALASVYRARGDYAKALECLNAIYAINPGAPPRYLPARAWIKARLGDYAGAVADMDRFLSALRRAGREFDDDVRRAMEERDSYLAMSRGASPQSSALPEERPSNP